MMNYDVVILGSGLAGLNSALQASKYGKVLVVTKSKLFECNSWHAQGGIAAVLNKGDNFKKHIQDTLVAGGNHNNKKAVAYFVKQAPITIKTLGKIGVPFEKTSRNIYDQNQEAGHRGRRIAHVGDHTGRSIMEALVKKVRDHKKIEVWQNCFAKDLIVINKTCLGVELIRNRKYTEVYARRIILATGGAGQLFQYTTNPKVTTGDGIALAARTGCRVNDMEFIQFHPTAFLNGGGGKAINYGKPGQKEPCESPLFLISETLRGEGAKLINAQGVRFMPKYHKLAELAPRDIVARAAFEEMKTGKIFLDIRHRTKRELLKKFPTIYAHLKKNGYDLSKDLIPIVPAAHYLCGGVVADVTGKTGIKNLYAVGEVACTGLQGANRLASNSLLEAAVMSQHVMDSPLPKTNHQTAPEPFQTGKDKTIPASSGKITALRETLQETMWECAGIVRTKKLLRKGVAALKEIKKQIPKKDSLDKFELQNMIQTGELILRASQKRTKSLGAHYRTN